jgi:hypothetical protein
LSGLVHGWSKAVAELREQLPAASTDEINKHPINVLWAFKVMSLAGRECLCNWCTDTWTEANETCFILAQSE